MNGHHSIAKIITNISLLGIILIPGNSIAGTSLPATKQTVYLSGTDSQHPKNWDFFCSSGRKSGYWTTLSVPSNWEFQGFGNYDYGRDYRTYGEKFRFARETGYYRHRFQVPESWKNKKVFLVFEGVMTDTQVKINGQSAGPVHQGAFYQFRYPVSQFLHTGSNLLEVTVHKFSANQSVNRAERYADFWIFGGIYRPVYLEIVPENYIDRVAVDAKADGQFRMQVFPEGVSQKETVSAKIQDPDGKTIQSFSHNIHPGDSVITMQTRIFQPSTWTSENPVRYTVTVTLTNQQKTVYRLSRKFGFRTIGIRRGDGIYINGVQVKMKGINRHSFWPETGRCITPEIDLNDAKLIKSMNMNAVRCSHYPPNQSFLEDCDSLGLYVLDELTGWQNAYDTQVGQKLVREMVIRDGNHPSVIFWCNGNEGGTNPELDKDFGIYDPSNRPVIHPHHKPGHEYNGIDCNHYENYYSSQKILQGKNIYMPTEYLHSQDDGGGGAGLDDFWNLFWHSKRSGGGFIWSFADEGIVRTDLNGLIDVNRLNAPDGVLGPHREKEGSYYTIRQIYCPVRIGLSQLPDTFNGRIPMENRYFFTNLKQVHFKWELVDFSLPQDREPSRTILGQGQIQGPDIAPGKQGNLQLHLPAHYKNADALYLHAFNVHGRELFCWSWRILPLKEMSDKLVKKTLTPPEEQQLRQLQSKGTEADNILPIKSQAGTKSFSSKVKVTEKDTLISLKASGITVTFNKNNGTISQLKNDFGLSLPFNNGPLLVSGKATLKSISHQQLPGACQLTMHYSGDLKAVVWTMYDSGWLQMDYNYQVKEPQYFTGITFSFPESDIIGVKWLGRGPMTVWKNRLKGGRLDTYQRYYNNELPGDNSWQYPPFKGYYKDVSWMEFNSVYGKFTMVTRDPDLFVRLFNFYGLPGPKNYPPLPAGDISFLDGIPPIGTKLAMGISNATWNLGPQGKLNQMEAPVHRTLFFYFGLLTPNPQPVYSP